jgi:DNA-binding beta-propeller fold protein YncE
MARRVSFLVALQFALAVLLVEPGGQAKAGIAVTSQLYSWPIYIPSVYRGGDDGVQIECVIFDGTNLWVSVQDHTTAFVYKLNTSGAILASVPVGVAPLGMAFDGTKLWVTAYTSSNITIVSGDGKTVLQTISTPGKLPEGILFDGKYIWVANNGAGVNTVSKYVAITSQYVADYPVGGAPDGFAYDGTYIWITNSYDNTVMRLDRESGAVLRTYPTGPFPVSIAYDGTKLWIGNGAASGGSLLALRALGGVNLGTVNIGSGIRGLVFDGSFVWACDSLDDSFSIVHAADGAVVATYPAGKSPRAIAYDGAQMWIANSGENMLTVVGAANGSKPGLKALAPPGAAESLDRQGNLKSGNSGISTMLEVLFGDN